MPRYLSKILIFIVFSLYLSHNGLAEDRVPVFVSIAPQKYFVQQIGRDRVNVQVMVQPGADPHTYEPKPRQMVAISRAKLYFAIGVEFERVKLKKIIATNPRIKVVHTDQGIEKIPMAARHHHEGKADHQTDAPYARDHDGGDSKNSTLDPHIWLSPPLVMIQAQTILKALQNIDPENSAAYEANYKAFLSSLTGLDRDLKTIFSGKSGLRFMVFHPSWGYFAHSYGLKQVPIELEGKKPKPFQLRELIEHARENQIKVIFAQPQISSESARLIAREIQGKVVLIDPLAENWSENLRTVADKFRSALRQ